VLFLGYVYSRVESLIPTKSVTPFGSQKTLRSEAGFYQVIEAQLWILCRCV
jgi:hypothetical protein